MLINIVTNSAIRLKWLGDLSFFLMLFSNSKSEPIVVKYILIKILSELHAKMLSEK